MQFYKNQQRNIIIHGNWGCLDWGIHHWNRDWDLRMCNLPSAACLAATSYRPVADCRGLWGASALCCVRSCRPIAVPCCLLLAMALHPTPVTPMPSQLSRLKSDEYCLLKAAPTAGCPLQAQLGFLQFGTQPAAEAEIRQVLPVVGSQTGWGMRERRQPKADERTLVARQAPLCWALCLSGLTGREWEMLG